MRTWHILLAGAAVLVGCGIFLALQDLGTATNWASVGSFFLALLTGIGSVLSLVSAKSKEESPGGVLRRSWIWILNVFNRVVINGDHNRVNITIDRSQESSTARPKTRQPQAVRSRSDTVRPRVPDELYMTGLRELAAENAGVTPSLREVARRLSVGRDRARRLILALNAEQAGERGKAD